MSLPHVGDIGITIEVTVTEGGSALDLSIGSVSTQELIFKKPDGIFETFTSVFKTDGTDGIVQYTTTTADDLDQDGPWQVQVHIIRTGENWRTAVGAFDVGPQFS